MPVENFSQQQKLISRLADVFWQMYYVKYSKTENKQIITATWNRSFQFYLSSKWAENNGKDSLIVFRLPSQTSDT